jgi:hypothetical protein|tara:strand:+ start:181 stop:471 length:291 start_codon:yes stop_codon:yes gene_type:complete
LVVVLEIVGLPKVEPLAVLVVALKLHQELLELLGKVMLVGLEQLVTLILAAEVVAQVQQEPMVQTQMVVLEVLVVLVFLHLLTDLQHFEQVGVVVA